MKKIIAIAVASAFAVPAFAADVSVSGDVEYMYVDGPSGTSFNSGDQDVTISGSEDLGNGMTVTASLELDGDSDTGAAAATADGLQSDSSLTITGDGFSVSIGDAVDSAVEAFDEVSDTAEQGGTGGDSAVATEHALLVTMTPADNVTLAISTGYEDDAADSTSSFQITSYAVQANVMGATVAYGIATSNEDGMKDLSTMSLSYAVGPVSIGYESIANVAYVDKDDQTNLGLSYAYGMGNLFIESGELKDDSASTKTETTAVGASYQLGAVNLYAVQNSVKTTTTDDTTMVGVEYAF